MVGEEGGIVWIDPVASGHAWTRLSGEVNGWLGEWTTGKWVALWHVGIAWHDTLMVPRLSLSGIHLTV